MNGVHDMGGMHGFGAVDPGDDVLFHADWEKTIFALNAAVGGLKLWNIDQSRSMMEKLPPGKYLSSSYFARFAARLEFAALAHGLVSSEEMTHGHMLQPARQGLPQVQAESLAAALQVGGPTLRPELAPARYKPGDLVRAREMHPEHHTRLPRYVRGKVGRIARVYGVHVFPDARVKGVSEDPHWLYAVTFDGPTLWGEDADPRSSMQVDAWEPYLEDVTT